MLFADLPVCLLLLAPCTLAPCTLAPCILAPCSTQMCKSEKRERKPSVKLAEAGEHASPANVIAKSPAKASSKKATAPKSGKEPAAVAPPAAKEDDPNQFKFALMGMTLSEAQSFLLGRRIMSPGDVPFRVDATEQGDAVTLKAKSGLAYWNFELTCMHTDASTWAPKKRERSVTEGFQRLLHRHPRCRISGTGRIPRPTRMYSVNSPCRRELVIGVLRRPPPPCSAARCTPPRSRHEARFRQAGRDRVQPRAKGWLLCQTRPPVH